MFSLLLDLYLWLTYRTFGLKRPMRLTWPLLYRQFGADPARSNDKFTVRDFRADCLRELKKSVLPGSPWVARIPGDSSGRLRGPPGGWGLARRRIALEVSC